MVELFARRFSQLGANLQVDYRALRDAPGVPPFGCSLAAQVYYHCLAEQAAAQAFRSLALVVAEGADPPTLHRWLEKHRRLSGKAAWGKWQDLLRDANQTLAKDCPPPAEKKLLAGFLPRQRLWLPSLLFS